MPGEETPTASTAVPALEPFNVKDCTGPAAGKMLCYYCRFEQRPVVCLFVRQMNDDIARLIVDVDALVQRGRDQRAAGFVVLLGEDTPAAERRLRELAGQRKIEHLPLTIYRDTPQKLANSLGVSSEAALTVRWWTKAEITGQCEFAMSPDAETSSDLLRELTQFSMADGSPANADP